MRKISKLFLMVLIVMSLAVVVPQMSGACDPGNSQNPNPCG